MKNNSFLQVLADTLFIVAGTFIGAMAMDIFLIPYKIAPGGASGLGMVVYYLSNEKISVGAMIIIINIPLFILGYRKMGKLYAVKSLMGTLLFSVFIDFFQPIANDISRYAMNIKDHAAPDLLLYSIFGGIIMGVGFGLVIRSGSSTGGSDIAAQLLHYVFPYITTGTFMLVVDAFIVAIVAVAFGNFIYSLYAAIAIILSSKLIDIVLEGLHHAKAVYIISDKSDLISERILHDLQRGVTALSGSGAYTGSVKNVLLCIVNNRQVIELKRLIASIDENAFVILAEVTEVIGEGFNVKKHYGGKTT